MACHVPGLIMAHMRSVPLKAYHVLGQITTQIRSDPLRGFGLNYDPYQIRPVNWMLCFWAHLLKAHLVIQPDISFVLLKACLTFRPSGHERVNITLAAQLICYYIGLSG